MARVSIDASEVSALAADMREIPSRLNRWVIPAVEKGAVNIKNQLRSEMSRSRHFGQIAPFIGYDMLPGTAVEAEIGPAAAGAGLLENIAYFGTSRGGGTVPDPRGALDAEAPRFERALADLMGDLL